MWRRRKEECGVRRRAACGGVRDGEVPVLVVAASMIPVATPQEGAPRSEVTKHRGKKQLRYERKFSYWTMYWC